jgi:preprotein translocase subunit YajC
MKNQDSGLIMLIIGLVVFLVIGYFVITENQRENTRALAELQLTWNGQTYTAGLEKGQQTQFQIDQEQCKTTLQQQLDAIIKEVKTKGQIDLQGTILVEKI